MKFFFDFRTGDSFTNGNASIIQMHSYLTEFAPSYKFYDWVGKFKLFKYFLLVSRSNKFPRICLVDQMKKTTEEQSADIDDSDSEWSPYNEYEALPKPQHFVIRDDFKPKITYVLASHRNDFFYSKYSARNQLQILKDLPSFPYPENWLFEEQQLVAFNSDYLTLSIVDKELVRRHFFNYTHFFLGCDTTNEIDMTNKLTMSKYLTRIRQYVGQALFLFDEVGNLIRNIATDVFGPASAEYSSFRHRLITDDMEEVVSIVTNLTNSSSSSSSSSSSNKNKQPTIVTSSSSNNSNNISIIKITKDDGKKDDDSPPHKIRKFFDVGTTFPVLKVYFMVNNDDDYVESFHRYSFTDTYTEKCTPGNSLLKAVTNLSKIEFPNETIPTYEDMRSLLVAELHKLVNFTNGILYFETSDNNDITFKNKFIELMREDPEYALAIPPKRTQSGKITLHDDPQEEIKLYINNKLNCDVELTKLDAIRLGICFDMNVIVLECTDEGDDKHSNYYHMFPDKDNHKTWIFLHHSFIVSSQSVLRITLLEKLNT